MRAWAQTSEGRMLSGGWQRFSRAEDPMDRDADAGHRGAPGRLRGHP